LEFSSVTLRICVSCFTLGPLVKSASVLYVFQNEKKGRAATHGVRDSESEGGKKQGRNVNQMGKVKFTFIFGSNTYAPS